MKEKFIKFMRGRYGIDILSRDLAILSLILSIVNMFLRKSYLSIVSGLILLILVYRTFSKRIYQRGREYQAYLNLLRPINQWFTRTKNKWKYRKEYKYFKCSECKQDLRVPKNKGKLRVNCPKCGHKMEIKS